MDKNFSQILEKEKERQNNSIVLIASENYASKDVREAQGSIFTNKYQRKLNKQKKSQQQNSKKRQKHNHF